MSNYTKTTNFTAKDSLPTGDANKKIKGVDMDTEFDAIAVAVATKAESSTVSANSPAGSIMLYAGSAAPTGFLLCDGSAVSRTTYSTLFAAIGTTFGAGDGSTTFNLPNFKGRAPYGVGQGNTAEGGGTGTNRTLGQSVGKETHTLITAELPVHSHTVTDPGHTHRQKIDGQDAVQSDPFISNSGKAFDIFEPTEAANAEITGSSTTGITLGNTGSGTAHTIVAPGLVVNFIIKT